MDRREAIAVIGGIALAAAAEAGARQAELPDFWKSRLTDVDKAVKQVQKGTTRVLTQSAGQRDLFRSTAFRRRG